jgi:hypothetical protein
LTRARLRLPQRERPHALSLTDRDDDRDEDSDLTSIAAEAATDRLSGHQPSRTRSLFAAAVAGVAAGVIVYKLLRSTDGAAPS